MTSAIIKYITITFIWSWGFWLAGWGVATSQNAELATGLTLFDLFSWQDRASNHLVAQLLFALAVFGAFVGYLAMRSYRPLIGTPNRLSIALTFGVPVALLLPALGLSALTLSPNATLTASAALSAVIAYFVSNFFTSGSEEFGWRGFLYPALKRTGQDFWTISLKGGVIWAVWHLPLMVMMYGSLGAAMIGILAGFVASIIAMNYITNVIYEESNSILLAMLLHALNNTAIFALTLFYPETPYTVVTAIMAWVVVGVLEKQVVKKYPAA